jgi:hypothetical protein
MACAVHAGLSQLEGAPEFRPPATPWPELKPLLESQLKSMRPLGHRGSGVGRSAGESPIHAGNAPAQLPMPKQLDGLHCACATHTHTSGDTNGLPCACAFYTHPHEPGPDCVALNVEGSPRPLARQDQFQVGPGTTAVENPGSNRRGSEAVGWALRLICSLDGAARYSVLSGCP